MHTCFYVNFVICTLNKSFIEKARLLKWTKGKIKLFLVIETITRAEIPCLVKKVMTDSVSGSNPYDIEIKNHSVFFYSVVCAYICHVKLVFLHLIVNCHSFKINVFGWLLGINQLCSCLFSRKIGWIRIFMIFLEYSNCFPICFVCDLNWFCLPRSGSFSITLLDSLIMLNIRGVTQRKSE